jgi:spore maturation protein CgeB
MASMRFLFLTHSIISDWNHGNAHFQRGMMRELIARGHRALAAEPADGWSLASLVAERGPVVVDRFRADFPELPFLRYRRLAELEPALDDADVVIVHEWTDPALVTALGRRRAAGAPFVLLFHDTHHRAVSAPEEMRRLDLDGYDGVLAFGAVLAETYRRHGWGRNVHVWHEAADTRLFAPVPGVARDRDLVWIGNWGDGERSAELADYLVRPVADLGLAATVHGVRYPDAARRALADAGIRYAGWLPNARVPAVFAAHRATVHVPRRFYAEALPGIPTIRMFEALACGIPLVSAPWSDAEGLFRTGEDYLTARSGVQMRRQLRRVLRDRDLAASLSRKGRETILQRHGCSHRADELFAILARIRPGTAVMPTMEAAE